MATSGCDDSSESCVLMLRLPDGRSLAAKRRALVGASPVIRAALKQYAAAAAQAGRPTGRRAAEAALPSNCSLARAHQADPGGIPGSAPGLLVDGDFEGWAALLQHLHGLELAGAKAAGSSRVKAPTAAASSLGRAADTISLEVACRLLPIARQYAMAGVMRACIASVKRAEAPPAAPLGCTGRLLGALRRAARQLLPLAAELVDPAVSLAELQGLRLEAAWQQQAALVRWLALGDAAGFSPLVHAGLAQLRRQGAWPSLRAALVWPGLRSCLAGLQPRTLRAVLEVALGLPYDAGKGAHMVGCISHLRLLKGPLGYIRPLRLAARKDSVRAALAPCDGAAQHSPHGTDCTSRAATPPTGTSKPDGEAQVVGQVAGQAHVLLRLITGQTIRAARAPLVAASTVIRDALACDQVQGFGAEGPDTASSPAVKDDVDGPCLPVEGCLDSWLLVLDFLADAFEQGALGVQQRAAVQLCPLAAFKVFRIAHMYDMAPLLSSCLDAMQLSLPGSVSVPVMPVQAQPEGRDAGGRQQPDNSRHVRHGLFEWLALGDSMQSISVVRGCLAELSRLGAMATLKAAMQSPQSRRCVEELRAGTLMEVLDVATDLPLDWKGVWVPDLSKPASIIHKVSAAKDGEQAANCCMSDSLVVFVDPNDECNVMVLDTHTGLTSRHSGHTDSVNRTAACTSASSGKQLILSGSFDQTVRLWDMSAGTGQSSLKLTLRGQDEVPGKGQVWGLCFCGERAAASGAYGSIRIWDLVSGSCSLSLAAGETWLTWLCASSDGHLLMSAHGEDEPAVVRLWDLRCASGGSVRALKLNGHEGCIWAVDMDAAGRRGISSSEDRTLRTWDLGSGRCSAVLEGHDHIVTSVQMDRHGTAAVSSSGYAEHAVRVWDLSRNTLVATYRPSRLVYTIASPDLSEVAALGAWGEPSHYSIHVWKN